MTHSTVLKTAGRGLFILLAMVLVTSFVTAQDLILNGNITNNNTISVQRNVVNNTAGTVTVGGTGTVRLTGNVGLYVAHSIQGGTGINFYRLDLRGNRPTTLAVTTGVSNRLRVGYTANTYTAGGNGFDIGANTLTIGGTSSYLGSALLTFNNGTVVYNGAAAQTLLSSTYGNLTTSGADKTASGDITVNSGNTFTNSANVDYGTNAFTGTGATFANTGTLISGGSVTLGTGTAVNGTFRYNQLGGSQTIASATYTNLDLTNTSAKTIGNAVIADVYTVAGGARTYTGGTTVTFNKAGDQTIPGESGYKNITLSGSGMKTLSGGTILAGVLDASATAVNVTADAGTTTLGSSSNFGGNLTVTGTLDGTASGSTTTLSGAAQSISGAGSITGFYNLTLSGTAAKSSSLDLAVSNTFTPTRGIDMGTNTLNITNSAAGAVGAFGSNEEVKGTLKRAVTTTGTYTYNNEATTVAFATAAPTDLTLTVQPTTNPTGYAAATHVNRNVTVAYTGAWAAGIATMKLGYVDAEKPSADENKVKFFEGSASSANKIATGNAPSRVAAGPGSFGTIQLVGLRPTGATGGILAAQVASGSEIVMSNISTAFMTMADGQNFSNGATWDEGVAPTSADDAQISHSGIIIDAASQVNLLTIDATKSMTLSAGDLTAGSVTNNGSITVDAGRNLNVPGAFSHSNTASLVVSGTANLLTGSVLTLASDGNITVSGATGILNVGKSVVPGPGAASNLTMSGTSVLTLDNIDSKLNLFGNLEIGATATLDNSGEITVGE